MKKDMTEFIDAEAGSLSDDSKNEHESARLDTEKKFIEMYYLTLRIWGIF